MTSIKPIVTNAATTSPCCGPSGCGTGTPPTHGAGTASAREVNEFGDPTGRNADGTVAPSVDLMAWIAANRHLMVPPVGNKYLYSGKDFFVMIIAGPNARNDFHMTNSEEFFIQLKGDIVVRIREGGQRYKQSTNDGSC